MEDKIQVTKNAFKAFEDEVTLAMNNLTRTMADVKDSDVLLMLRNPGKEIEVVDPATKKAIVTVAGGIGAAGLAAASGTIFAGVAAGAAAGGVAASGVAAGGAIAIASLGTKGALAASTVPGPGWIIGGAILAVTAVTATTVAIISVVDKKKVEKHANEMQALYQKAIKKLKNEIETLKREGKENDKRLQYIVNIHNFIKPAPSPV